MKTKALVKPSLLLLFLLGTGSPACSERSPDSLERDVFHVNEIGNGRCAMLGGNCYPEGGLKAAIVFVNYAPGIDIWLEHIIDLRAYPFDPAAMNLVVKGVTFRSCAATLDARSMANKVTLDAAMIFPSTIQDSAQQLLKQGHAYLKPQ